MIRKYLASIFVIVFGLTSKGQSDITEQNLLAVQTKFEHLYTEYGQNKVKGQSTWLKYNESVSLANEKNWIDLYVQLTEQPQIVQKTTFQDLLKKFKHQEEYKDKTFLGLINLDYLYLEKMENVATFLQTASNPFSESHLFVASLIGNQRPEEVVFDKEFLVGDILPTDSFLITNLSSGEEYLLPYEGKWSLPESTTDLLFEINIWREGRTLSNHSCVLNIPALTYRTNKSGNKIRYLHNDYCGKADGDSYSIPYYDPTQWIPEPDFIFTATARIPYDIPVGTPISHYQGWLENDKLASPYGKADVTIIYAEGRDYLKKPIIFVTIQPPVADKKVDLGR
jgi:hypothetical protein